MRKLWIIIVVVSIVIVGIVLIATQTEKESNEIKIGVIGPLTGIRAMGGTYMRNGLEIALEEINSKGGIKGEQIKLIYEDDKYEPSIAVSGFRKLVDVDGVKMVIGFQNSSCLLAVAPIAEQQRIIVIGYGTQASKISDAGDYIFRTQISSLDEIPVISEFIKNKLNISEISVLYLNTDYGVEYKDALKSTFEASLQDKIIAIDLFEVETTDYKTQLGKVTQQNPQAIFIIGSSKHVGMIVKQAKELGIKTSFIASSPVEGEDVLTIAGTLVDGIIYPYPYDVESEDKEQEAFRKKYKERYGMLPEMLAANAYDALKILADGIGKCGQNIGCIKDFLYTVKDYHGASGLLSFDSKGDVHKPIIIKKIEDGKFIRY